MVRDPYFALIVSTFVGGTACATAGTSSSSIASMGAPAILGDVSNDGTSARSELPCTECDVIPMPSEITRAVEARLVALRRRGGECSRYGTVLESSYRSGRITIRQFMWRVGAHLASGVAKPNGEMTLAREIDSLNVGVRTVDDVLWSMEHEAVHITFDLPSGDEVVEEKANQIVRACKD